MKYTPEQVMAAVETLAANERRPKLSATTGDIARQCRHANGDDEYRRGTADVVQALQTLVDEGKLVTHKKTSPHDRRTAGQENPAYSHISSGYQERWYATPANSDKIKAEQERYAAAADRADAAAEALEQALLQGMTDEPAWTAGRYGEEVRLTMTAEQAEWLTALLKRGN